VGVHGEEVSRSASPLDAPIRHPKRAADVLAHGYEGSSTAASR
jgi:hypothetical protein